jgi:hypothetical protein
MSNASAKTPWHLWLVSVFAVLFNLIGVVDFVMNLVQGPSYMASMGMTPEQIAHYQQMPGWMMGVWAVGVFGAFAASLLLVLRKALAFHVFIVSLLAFLLSLVYTYLLTNGGKLMGAQMSIISAVIAVLLILFSAYARFMAQKGVLR